MVVSVVVTSAEGGRLGVALAWLAIAFVLLAVFGSLAYLIGRDANRRGRNGWAWAYCSSGNRSSSAWRICSSAGSAPRPAPERVFSRPISCNVPSPNPFVLFSVVRQQNWAVRDSLYRQ